MTSPALTTQAEKNAHYRAVLATYVQLVTAREVEAILLLFASDAILEDPVGAGRPVIGVEALRDFYTKICDRGLTLQIDGHISCARANVACAPIRIDVDTSITRAISVAYFDEQGLITRYDAHWGPGDIERLDEDRVRPTDVAPT
ncbi:nuclear transport factor 2 family protein [Sphingopyxis sp. MSC1_008]|jgi:steroid delta-isomerase|uniref:nuclear transport factor 2 family protein n=1 Tax=Sphingopyxis sp. MSC1_008 TaxID=2909265 RepID=UPI0020BDEB87|nr:nuclear transport factor 2 family protein [Sphingopyxis sp. MSC1_008]